MEIKIDQDVLCDHCCDYHDSESFRDRCEGSQCDEARSRYLDDNGLTEDTEGKTFRKLIIGDDIYKIKNSGGIPSIKKCKINSMSQMNEDKLRLHYESESVYIEVGNENCKNQGNYYTDKKDCEKRLEEICTSMIIQLSKIIGSISNS